MARINTFQYGEPKRRGEGIRIATSRRDRMCTTGPAPRKPLRRLDTPFNILYGIADRSWEEGIAVASGLERVLRWSRAAHASGPSGPLPKHVP